MHATLPLLQSSDFPAIRRQATATLQVNLGYRCNQSCVHCHVNAGPNRTEMMDAETMALIPQVLAARGIGTLDLTGGAPELHTVAERFVKDLLLRLRASPTANPDINAYRKAFLNALNLQRVEDVDLFVRTLVAEDRPTDIARFRALLESFRQIRDRIEQVRQRIEAAEGVERQYDRIATQAVRAASYRALAAEYARDLYGEQLERAEGAVTTAEDALADTRRRLVDARAERDTLRDEQARANARLQGNSGYGEQAQLDELAGRDRERLAQLNKELLREIGFVRDTFRQLDALALRGIEAGAVDAARADWDAWHAALSALADGDALPWTPEDLFARARQALRAAEPTRNRSHRASASPRPGQDLFDRGESVFVGVLAGPGRRGTMVDDQK